MSTTAYVLTVAEAIHAALHAADEAESAVMEATNNVDQARAAAAMAYRNNMPALSSVPAVRAYIGCVARGLQLRYLSQREAKLLMWGVQLWMGMEKSKEVAA